MLFRSEGPQKDPRFLAVALATRMLWFLHRQDFPRYVDDDAALGVPEMTKKMGRCMPPISARHPN